MRLIDHEIILDKKTDRVEIFPFGDTHIGKRNCCEEAIRKQVAEVVRRSKMPNRHVRVLFGGDICDYIKPKDLKRYDANVLADWIYKGTPEQIRKRLSDITTHQLRRAKQIFEPVKPFVIGAIEGNHEFSMMHHNNEDAHGRFCEMMGTEDLTDEAIIRFRFRCKNSQGSRCVFLYLQHGFGGGRSESAEALWLARIRDEWQIADVCLRGHSHTHHVLPPSAVLHISTSGILPEEPYVRHRLAANWGFWCTSHAMGPSTYESRACYRAKAMMTCKVVIWPMYRIQIRGKDVVVPKIEIRSYPIL